MEPTGLTARLAERVGRACVSAQSPERRRDGDGVAARPCPTGTFSLVSTHALWQSEEGKGNPSKGVCRNSGGGSSGGRRVGTSRPTGELPVLAWSGRGR